VGSLWIWRDLIGDSEIWGLVLRGFWGVFWFGDEGGKCGEISVLEGEEPDFLFVGRERRGDAVREWKRGTLRSPEGKAETLV
jgi:hypothetical protein